MYIEIKNKKYKDHDPEIIAWLREEKQDLESSLIYIYPQPGDKIRDKKYFAVKDYERVLFYNKGELYGVVKGGIFKLDKDARVKGTEIVWIDTTLTEIPWGIPINNGVLTKDGYMVGLHGDLKLKISDVKIFYNEVAAGEKEWTVQNLKDWIMSLLITSLRDIFKSYGVKDIILEEREKVIDLITAKVTEEFVRYGLELETFNIIGLKTGDEAKEVLTKDKQKTKALIQAERDDLDELMRTKDDLQDRIKDLKNKKKKLQDKLLNDEIKQDQFDKKKAQIDKFIKEAKEEMKSVDEALSK